MATAAVAAVEAPRPRTPAVDLEDFHSLADGLLRRFQDLTGSQGKTAPSAPDSIRDVENKLQNLVRAVAHARDVAKLGPAPDLDEKKKDAQYRSVDAQLRFVPEANSACQDIRDYLAKAASRQNGKSPQALLEKIDQDEEFRSLSKRLIEGTDDFSILEAVLSAKEDNETAKEAALGHLKGQKFYHVPLSRVQDFVGQEDILSDLDFYFAQERGERTKPLASVLCGMGGQGKTQIALEHCQASRQRESYSGIFWVDASSKTSTERGMEEIAELLKSENQSLVDAASRIAFAKEALSGWDEKWLLVFDNHDNPAGYDVEDFFPQSSRGSILVTSRSHHSKHLGRFIEVVGMLESDALDLFFQSSKAPRDATQEWHAKNILARLGVLPLAIHQAATYLHRTGNRIKLEDFLAHYEAHKVEVMSESRGVKDYLDRSSSAAHSESAKSVFTTWSMAFQLLQPETPSGAKKVEFLHLLGFFDEFDISEQLFRNYVSRLSAQDSESTPWASLFLGADAAWAQDQFEAVLSELLELSLITFLEQREDTHWHFALHPLVKDWIRIRQDGTAFRHNVAIASKILATSLMEYFWTLSPDGALYSADVVSNSMGFAASMDITTRTSFFAHLASWKRNFDELEDSLMPTYFTSPAHGEVAAELVFGLFFLHYSLCNDAYAIAQWLWDTCSVDTAPGRTTKAVAGGLIVELHMAMRKQVHSLMEFSRENLKLWESYPDLPEVDRLIWNAKYVLIVAIEHHGTKEAIEEGSKICREVLLAENPRNYLFELELADFVSRQPLVTDHDSEIIDLYEHVVQYGDPEEDDLPASETATPQWRRSRIGYRQWTLITKICRTWPLGHPLVMEMIEAMRHLFGDNHVFTYAALMRGAMSWLDRGNSHQALNITALCVANLRRSPPHDGILFNALRLHGDILYIRGQKDEALLCYREGLRELEKVEQGVKGFDGHQLLWRLADCLKEANETELAIMAYRSIITTEKALKIGSVGSIMALNGLLRQSADESQRKEAAESSKKLMDSFLEWVKADPIAAEDGVETGEVTFESPRFLFAYHEDYWGSTVYIEHATALTKIGQADQGVEMVSKLFDIISTPELGGTLYPIKKYRVMEKIRAFNAEHDPDKRRALDNMEKILAHVQVMFGMDELPAMALVALDQHCRADVTKLKEAVEEAASPDNGEAQAGIEVKPPEPELAGPTEPAEATERVSRARRIRNRLSAFMRSSPRQ